MRKHQSFAGAACGLFLVLLVGRGPLLAQLEVSPAPTAFRESTSSTLLPAPNALGLADLLRLSLEANPSLSQARFDVDAARGRALQAGLYPNPTVAVRGEEVGGRVGRGGIVNLPEVSQEIVTGGKLRLSRAVAEREVDQTTLAVLRQRFVLFTAVRQGYFEVLTIQRRIDVLDELVKLATRSADNAQKVLGAGEVAEPDVLQFQIEFNRFLAERESAQQELIAAWRRLTATMGTPGLPYSPLAGSLEAPLPDYDFERARACILELHPEIRSAQVGITRAQLALRRAQAEPIPNVTVGAGYVANFKDRDSELAYQVSVPLPLFNRNQGNIHAAEAELGRAVREVDRVQNDLINRLAAAFGQYAAARQRAERYRTTIMPAAGESYRLTVLAFRGGQFEYLRVLQAQRAIGEANLTYIQALLEEWRAASDIAGLLLEEDWPAPTVTAFEIPLHR